MKPKSDKTGISAGALKRPLDAPPQVNSKWIRAEFSTADRVAVNSREQFDLSVERREGSRIGSKTTPLYFSPLAGIGAVSGCAEGPSDVSNAGENQATDAAGLDLNFADVTFFDGGLPTKAWII